jgi:hypothetical protein
MKETGGAADDVTDDEIREGIRLLAENEGIFAETAGGVTVGVAKKLIASGKIPANDSAVLCITGNGLKTLDAVVGHVGKTREIKPSLREFEAMLASEENFTLQILGLGLLPAAADRDAGHIALATVYEMDILLTWNCRHIANASIQARLRKLAEKSGLTLPVVCTPDELTGDLYEE